METELENIGTEIQDPLLTLLIEKMDSEGLIETLDYFDKPLVTTHRHQNPDRLFVMAWHDESRYRLVEVPKLAVEDYKNLGLEKSLKDLLWSAVDGMCLLVDFDNFQVVRIASTRLDELPEEYIPGV
jgi:hypothetical protein